MSFTDDLKQFTQRVENVKDTVQTEEATKMSLIVPFFQMLGYDVFNPLEFCPEFTADVGIKKGEKVDYAILINNEPVILIEAKSTNRKLDKHSSQLFRYFVSTAAKFAILTNGIVYKFYTDLEEANKMDKEPFLEVNLLNLTEAEIIQIEKFQKQNLNINDILDTASVLKYNTLFKKSIEQQFLNPSDDLVKLFLQPIYKGAKTQGVIEKFRPILKKALTDYVNDTVNSKIKFALDNSSSDSQNAASPGTDEEWEAVTIIKDILKDTIDVSKISLKYTESYIAILYQNNVRKWICRLMLSSNQKLLITPDENKKEQRRNIDMVSDIPNFSDEIISAAKRYLESANAKSEVQELEVQKCLYTKWGTYNMPEPYSINLIYGPRKDVVQVK